MLLKLILSISLLYFVTPMSLSIFTINLRAPYFFTNLSTQPFDATNLSQLLSSNAFSFIYTLETGLCYYKPYYIHQSKSYYSILSSNFFLPPPFYLYAPNLIHLYRFLIGIYMSSETYLILIPY